MTSASLAPRPRALIENRCKLVWNPYDHIEIEGTGVAPVTALHVPKPRAERFDFASNPELK